MQDVSASKSKRCPQLYKAGIDNLYFKWRVIIVWLVAATFQSLIFFYFPVAGAQSAQNGYGKMLGVWDVSTMAYTCILITVNLRLMMASSSLTKWHHISVGCSIGAWFVFVFIYSGVQVSFRQVLPARTYFDVGMVRCKFTSLKVGELSALSSTIYVM